jgi:hypothetical protein
LTGRVSTPQLQNFAGETSNLVGRSSRAQSHHLARS